MTDRTTDRLRERTADPVADLTWIGRAIDLAVENVAAGSAP